MKPIRLSHEDLKKMGIEKIENLQNLSPATIFVDEKGIEITLIEKGVSNV